MRMVVSLITCLVFFAIGKVGGAEGTTWAILNGVATAFVGGAVYDAYLRGGR